MRKHGDVKIATKQVDCFIFLRKEKVKLRQVTNGNSSDFFLEPTNQFQQYSIVCMTYVSYFILLVSKKCICKYIFILANC